jgi:UDP-N-acetylmuramyl pentapeptide phosphotransferase/UDP-N-acetylglucosamine-1-phosphate transferase
VTAAFSPMPLPDWSLLLLAAVLAALLSAGLIRMIRPLLLKHALARPNARSSHRVPTPQGAGIAVILATLVSFGIAVASRADLFSYPALTIFGATLFIAAVGLADDIRSIPVLPRLLLQAVAVAAIIAIFPGEFRITPALPFWLERGLLLLAGLWFVNLVNFMDGLDWMTVAEVVPITAAVTMLGLYGELPSSTAAIAAALCGAMIGFAPFNRPVASIFLGDVGSLPIGLLLGWCLLQLAFHQHVAAALLLPLYYLADATVTLLRRMTRGEPFWIAHRSHFYQRATDNGFSVLEVVSGVFVLNLALAAFALASIYAKSFGADLALVALGAMAVAFSLYRFSRKRT